MTLFDYLSRSSNPNARVVGQDYSGPEGLMHAQGMQYRPFDIQQLFRGVSQPNTANPRSQVVGQWGGNGGDIFSNFAKMIQGVGQRPSPAAFAPRTYGGYQPGDWGGMQNTLAQRQPMTLGALMSQFGGGY